MLLTLAAGLAAMGVGGAARGQATRPAAGGGGVAPAVDAAKFADADAAVGRAVAEGKIPGAVLVVGRRAGVVYEKAYGSMAVAPTTRPMAVDTVFDLASLTKPMATATSVMKLVGEGKIDLDAPAARYLPDFAQGGKGAITIEQLLRHHSGLIADNPMGDYDDGPAAALAAIDAAPPKAVPGEAYIYSDVNFIVLAEVVRAVSGRPVDEYAAAEVFAPLGMDDTGFRPPASLRPRIAPTERRGGEFMVGDVHDPRAWALGGVAGHAGLFGTAGDVARWCRMLMNGGELDGARVLSESAVAQMVEPKSLPDGTGSRGLGVDVDSPYAPSPRGDRFPAGTTFGHTGWTGTMFWVDPAGDAFVVLLTNRVHPDGKGEVLALRRAVSTAAAEAMLGPGE